MEKENNYLAGINNLQQEQQAVPAREMIRKYLQYSWLFILILGLTFAIAWLYMRYTKPVYNVSSTLLIRSDNTSRSSNGMNSQDMFSDIALFQANANKQNEILILSSRSMMERVVKALEIQKLYSVVGNVKTIDIFPEQPFEVQILSLADSSVGLKLDFHFNQDWTSFQIGKEAEVWLTGQEITIPQGKIKVTSRNSVYRNLSFRDFIFQNLPIHEAALNYLGGLQVKPANDQSNVLSLVYINENPILATAMLNELMVQYNDAAIEDKNEMNRKILAFINDRLHLVETQLDSVEGNLQKYRTSKEVINLASQSQLYFGNVNELTENLRVQQVRLQIIELLEEYLNQASNRNSLVPSTLGLEDPTLIELTSAYNRLVGERLRELQTGATINNPVVVNLDKNIEEAKRKILVNLANMKSGINKTISSLQDQSGIVRKEILSIPEREKVSREKARQQEIKQNLYLYLMQKREESEIAQASTIANSRIIDTALPVYNLVSPIVYKVYGIALIIGLILPILIIYLRDILNDKVTIRSDITMVTDAPLIGEVGHSSEEKVLLFPNNSRTIVAEQMRILRSNLRFVLGEKFEHPTILVTSSFSGEGKSFISTNLGATLAVSGKRTVILEFDLRKPKILAGLGLPKGHGLTNFLVGDAKLNELAQAVPLVDGLFVIPCGPVPPNPSEILLTPKIKELFVWLKEQFDVIVIDTAPVGLVSDAFTLSHFADATIYVVRQRYTFKRQLNFIDELYKLKRLPNMGLLVNDVVVEGTSGYYGYGGSRYGYGYGYGYAAGYVDVEKNNNETFKKLRKKFFQRK